MRLDPDDFEAIARRYSATFDYAGWCQLCGGLLPAGEVVWQLQRKRAGSGRYPIVCVHCFWQDGEPTVGAVHRKIRFRVAHHKTASLSKVELKTALDALDAVRAGSYDSMLEDFMDVLKERLAADRTNMTNDEASRLADALSELDGVTGPDPEALASDLWEVRITYW